MQVHLTTQAVKERAVLQDSQGQCLYLDDARVAIQRVELIYKNTVDAVQTSINCGSLDVGVEMSEVERDCLGLRLGQAHDQELSGESRNASSTVGTGIREGLDHFGWPDKLAWVSEDLRKLLNMFRSLFVNEVESFLPSRSLPLAYLAS